MLPQVVNDKWYWISSGERCDISFNRALVMMAMRFEQDGNEDGDDDVILLQTVTSGCDIVFPKVASYVMASAVIWDWLAMKTMMILLQTELARFPTWLHKVPRTSMAAAFDELEVGRRLHIIVTSTTVIFIITTPITSISIVVSQGSWQTYGGRTPISCMAGTFLFPSPVQRPIFVCSRNCTFRFLFWLFCELRFWIFYNFCNTNLSRTAYMHRVTAPNRFFLVVVFPDLPTLGSLC